jgi:hypothetical protein
MLKTSSSLKFTEWLRKALGFIRGDISSRTFPLDIILDFFAKTLDCWLAFCYNVYGHNYNIRRSLKK